MFAFLIVVATLLIAFSCFNAWVFVMAARDFFVEDDKERFEARYASVFFAIGAFSSGYLAYFVLGFVL